MDSAAWSQAPMVLQSNAACVCKYSPTRAKIITVSLVYSLLQLMRNTKYCYGGCEKLALSPRAFHISLRSTCCVSPCLCLKGVRREGEAALCVSPCSPPVSLDAELLSRNCMWAVCSGSRQICCFSTAVHPSHPCMSKHATLGRNTAGFSSAEKLTCEALLICTASGQH